MNVQENKTTQQAAAMAAVLAMPERRSTPPRMPPAPLPIRLKTSPPLRRLLPTRLVVSRAERKGERIWEQSAAERAYAVAGMQTIVAGTRRADELTELAREHLIERQADSALFWQPWRTPSIDERSAARLQGALASGRGALLSSCHHGPFFLSMQVVASMGHVPFAVGGPWFFEKPSPDYWGRRLARWWKGACTRTIISSGSFPILQALLERGESIFLTFDMPGPRETRFLGKPAMLADGSARLAEQADALVVPMRVRRVGHRARLDVAEPLDPRDFAGLGELHDALARVHEDWILELPAEMADPREFGWGAAATADAWMRPARS